VFSQDGTDAFWNWWKTSGRERILAAIEGEGFNDALVEDIASHVAAVGDDLDWEMSPGKTAHHAFCVSSKGQAEGRLTAELWRNAGPPDDETWEFFAARQPRPDPAIEYEGVHLAAKDIVVAFEVDEGRERVHGEYYHPAFEQLEEDARGVTLFLLLDGTFGEDGVERWLGGIDVAASVPANAVPLADLCKAVEELSRNASGERFALLQGERDGEPYFALVDLSLKRVDHLLHRERIVVEIAIHDRNEHGLPTNADAEVLNRLEDELTTALGDRAVYFGRETLPGRRLMHWYAPPDSPAHSIAERWAREHPDRDAKCTSIHDPSWEFVKRF
jgi:hypothetical protein